MLKPLENQPTNSPFLWILKDVSLFSDLSKSSGALEDLACLMTERSYSPGQDIVREGDAGSEMFVLIEGQASVYKSTPGGDHYKVAIFDGKKHIGFGEAGLIEGEQRSATIRADSVCRLLVLEKKSFESFSQKNPQAALPIYSRIAQNVMIRLRKTNEDMLLLYNALVDEIRGR